MTISRVRQTPGGVDPYGDPIAGTEAAEEIPGAFVAPRTSNDIDGPGRAGMIIGLTLYLPYGYDLTHQDLVDVDGERYRVDGDPGHWLQPMTGWKAGAEVALVRAQG